MEAELNPFKSNFSNSEIIEKENCKYSFRIVSKCVGSAIDSVEANGLRLKVEIKVYKVFYSHGDIRNTYNIIFEKK